jgi:hypothetical protein
MTWKKFRIEYENIYYVFQYCDMVWTMNKKKSLHLEMKMVGWLYKLNIQQSMFYA